jgi:hypothetical protein
MMKKIYNSLEICPKNRTVSVYIIGNKNAVNKNQIKKNKLGINKMCRMR